MLYVVVDELIPESHLRGTSRLRPSRSSGASGPMMFLDNVFG
jgi:hypothetical protein